MKYIKLVGMLALAVLFVQAAPNGSGYSVGDTAMDFNLKNIDGNMVSMADFDDAKGFIVVFTCNHCPYAKMYEERIVALDAQYAKKGYPVIAVNPNDPEKVGEDSFEEMKKRADDQGFTFPYLVDATSEVASTYGATKTPHVYVLEKEGDDLKVRYIGAIDNNYRDASAADQHYVQDAVDALLKGKEVPTTETRAIGCSIKWRES